MSKVVLITLGCKQNKYESDCMATILENAGYEVSEDLDLADIYVINTCAVTAEAEKKSRQYIAKINKLNSDAKIIICGCASENNIEQFKNKNNVYSIIGTEGKERILEIINNSVFEKFDINTQYCSVHTPKKTTTREYIKIQDGCNNFCTYCIIPYLRGRTRSRGLEEIISEAKAISTRSREIVLTGIDISSYQVDGKPALGLLMSRLKDIDALIRLGSLEIGVITKELLEILSSMDNFAPHFHLSLQSGDNEILKKMNRKYTTDEFYEKVCLIREYFPLANITTDIIVGFAGETEEQFENTKAFVEKVEFSFVHIFPYSKRAGTIAYRFEDLPLAIKKDRVDKLEVVNRYNRMNYLSMFVGRESTMLVEEKKEWYEGFSPEYIRCYTDDEVEPGNIYKIKFVDYYREGMVVNVIKEN
ncbi:MAG: tRNA (N(6)-L-threonylcarbamoyladenosine(37)-C(2))-methylthiotransferase MtaB [Clostridiales bacterium]|nr:tRNA (N(6)-L-threonylcarbamoyladenosine(37)-C(2))-methylthiotransferase MtaB [Clostridiales bacterium]